MEKHLAVKVAGSGEPREVTIHPGSAAGDVLDALGLNRSLVLTQDSTGKPFGLGEMLWDKVSDGQKLYAVPPMDVGE